MVSDKIPRKKTKGIVFNKKPASTKPPQGVKGKIKSSDKSIPDQTDKELSATNSASSHKIKTATLAEKSVEGKNQTGSKTLENPPKKIKSAEEKDKKEKQIYQNTLKSTVKVLNDIEGRKEKKEDKKKDVKKIVSSKSDLLLNKPVETFKSNKEFKQKMRSELNKQKTKTNLSRKEEIMVSQKSQNDVASTLKKVNNTSKPIKKSASTSTIFKSNAKNQKNKKNEIVSSEAAQPKEKAKPKRRHRIVMRSVRLKNKTE